MTNHKMTFWRLLYVIWMSKRLQNDRSCLMELHHKHKMALLTSTICTLLMSKWHLVVITGIFSENFKITSNHIVCAKVGHYIGLSLPCTKKLWKKYFFYLSCGWTVLDNEPKPSPIQPHFCVIAWCF